LIETIIVLGRLTYVGRRSERLQGFFYFHGTFALPNRRLSSRLLSVYSRFGCTCTTA